MRYSETNSGDLELHICDDPDRFREVANKIQAITKGDFGEYVAGPDQSYWDIMIEGDLFTIHREHYLGVSIFSGSANARHVFETIERELKL